MKAFFGHLLAIGLLTLFTQIGGVIYLLILPVFYWINNYFEKSWKRRIIKNFSFSINIFSIDFFHCPTLSKMAMRKSPASLVE